MLGRPARPSAAPTAAPTAAQAGCEWLEKQGSFSLSLPDFPTPADGSWHSLEQWLPPIPRLLPSWAQLQQLQSSLPAELYLDEGEMRPVGVAFGARDTHDPSRSAAIGAGGAVLSLSAGLVVWRCVGHLYRRNVQCRLSWRRRS